MLNKEKRNNLKSDILTTKDEYGRIVVIKSLDDGVQIESNDFKLNLTQENLKDLSEYGGNNVK